ncbi:MAG: hypothetical protein M1816_006283 [Peltula sp. TS41687]|nr:MAG: hypothetical protein M1816_006283 [Peltula sp. TS41687]
MGSYRWICPRTPHRSPGRASHPTHRVSRIGSSSSSSSRALSTSALDISTPPDRATISIKPPPHPPPIDRDYLKIADNALAFRWETTAPSATQLRYADLFFQAQPPKFLYSAAKFRTINFADAPEVAFFGRSNVGKSSLINAMLGQNICHTSKKLGRTKTMNAIAVKGGSLVVLDMPGYGKGSRAEWGDEILKYLSERKALRRAFLLIDAKHGVKSTDAQLLTIFRENAIPHQILLSKVDRILFASGRTPSPRVLRTNFAQLRRHMAAMREKVQPAGDPNPPALGEILSCSAEKSPEKGRKLGVSGIRWAVLAAAGLESESGYGDVQTVKT